MASQYTYKNSQTEDGKEYKYVEIKGYKVIPIESHYIKPNESIDFLIENVCELCEEDDYLVIAETPISVSQGRLVDEAEYTPSLKATFLATYWSKYLWGYILGPLLGIKERTIKNLRRLPEESKRHKEVILDLYGWKHALKPASEAGFLRFFVRDFSPQTAPRRRFPRSPRCPRSGAASARRPSQPASGCSPAQRSYPRRPPRSPDNCCW